MSGDEYGPSKNRKSAAIAEKADTVTDVQSEDGIYGITVKAVRL